MNNRTDAVINEIEKVIIGKREVVERVLMAILSEGHILLDDVPGVGKTTLAVTCSVVMGVQYQRMQFTPDVVPSDIVGFSVYNKATGGFDYKPGVVMTNLLLADEINRTSSKTQSALLEVMEEGQVTVDGVTHPLPKPFVVIATQNPVGSAGTQLLPQAQLDRFMIRLQMGYPDFKSQVDILRDRQKVNPLDQIQKVIGGEDIIAMQQEVKDIHVEDAILEYVTSLAMATREDEMIRLGVSPRGALAIVRMAKAHAYLDGRNYVTPEDVQKVFIDVCAHRIILNPKASGGTVRGGYSEKCNETHEISGQWTVTGGAYEKVQSNMGFVAGSGGDLLLRDRWSDRISVAGSFNRIAAAVGNHAFCCPGKDGCAADTGSLRGERKGSDRKAAGKEP